MKKRLFISSIALFISQLIGTFAAEVHIPVLEPSTIIDGVYVIPYSTENQITIASDGYCRIYEVWVDGKYVWSGTNYKLAPVTITLPQNVMDRDNHSMKIEYDYDPSGYLKSINYTFRVGGCSTGSSGDFSINDINYQIVSQSDLKVNCVGGSVIGHLNIPESVNYNNRTYSVVGIGNQAFKANEYLTEITLPLSVNTIGDEAFKNCIKLSQITGGQGIERIGNSSFENCTVLQNIELYSNLKTIEGLAFKNNKSLSEITFPNVAEITLGNGVFSGCRSLNVLNLKNAIKEIGSSCFEGCESLIQAFLSPNISAINNSAFDGCKSLTEVFFLSNLSINTSQVFSNCHSGIEFYVPSVKQCGFGKEYITFHKSIYQYTGITHNIDWSNNLRAYNCSISESECKTEINAGTYTKNLTATYSNGVDFSVEIPYTYTVNRAPMNMTVHDAQREYGEPNPAFTCSLSGFVNGENEQSLNATPSFECEATKYSNVGSYRILASIEAPNYEITYSYGTLSVLKAPLSVSVDNAMKVYGNINPEFSLSYSGLKNEENQPVWVTKPVFTTSATVNSDVGEYKIEASNGTSQNYEVTSYSPGVLSVIKRDLTVKANDFERLYGEDNPPFTVSCIGFVNGDNESDLTEVPTAECSATKDSDAGSYPISVNGGEASNYNFLYQDGILTIQPLTVGFKDVYNSVTYNDMAISTTDNYFNFIPEIVGPYSSEDFWLDLWFLDKDNKYSQHVSTISGGDYAGNYVNTNTDRLMNAGKYIFNLKSKGTNPNVVANPSRAYLTVNRASTNLEWEIADPIEVGVGEKVDLGISYQADMWCIFNTYYDEELISLTADGENSNEPHWYATGLKEGETNLSFSIECLKNDMGFYDFSDSRTVSKRINVVKGVGGVESVHATDQSGLFYVYNLQGILLLKTDNKDKLNELSAGLYIVNGKKILVK